LMIFQGGKVKYLSFSDWNWPWLIHGFSTRWGGVSNKEYRQLNMAGRGDNASNIRKNRALFLKEMGLINPRVFMGEQVHGTNIKMVNQESSTIKRNTDGLLTKESQNVLLAFFADCVPLFLVVPEYKTVGIIHAGWKGTAQKIASRAVEFLCKNLEIGPDKIRAGLGPAIGPCCYEVGAEVAEKFLEKEIISRPRKKRFFLDLPQVNIFQLEDAGVPAANIGKSGFCTACNPHLFYSHRRDGEKTGRMASLIAII